MANDNLLRLYQAGIVAVVLHSIFICGLVGEEHYSISQISPKSDTFEMNQDEQLETSLGTTQYSTAEVEAPQNYVIYEDELSDDTADNDHNHIRLERSALPVLNRLSNDINELDSNDMDRAGRYYDLIKPTQIDNHLEGQVQMTQSQRTAKDMSLDSFLMTRGLRLLPPETPINPTSVLQTFPSATLNAARQNPNPDIQDIITGIVKLLNGNVNVHTNTQLPSIWPMHSRINNRGPPRISEAQPIPQDYEAALTPPSSTSKPPYPFERPDGPIRPFLTGVPIPEQIVPNLQPNYRPGFVSQNRPPWQLNRPRPPISSRRPPPPSYKPIPQYRPENDMTLNHSDEMKNISLVSLTNLPIGHQTEEPIVENQDVVSETEKLEKVEETTTTTTEVPVKKEEIVKKKDKTNNKQIDKKPTVPTNTTPTINATKVDMGGSKPTVITIIESSSEVNLVKPTYSTMTKSEAPTSTSLEPSIETTTTTTTGLVSTPVLKTTVPAESGQSTITPVNNGSVTPSPALVKPSTSPTPNAPYHPRPGIVLDDPEFKPGHGRPGQRPPQRPPIQATRPLNNLPGYGEIFDVTLSAIQGLAGGGSGGKQTINIKPYNDKNGGGYGTDGVGNEEIIISPSGDDGFVSIDGKRTYINLFGEPTDGPAVSTKVQTPLAVKPTNVIAPGVTGSGYVVAETEPPVRGPLPPQQQPSRPIHRPRPVPQHPPVRIDTCIVGDDTTCDQAQNEKCRTDNGVSSCHCRPGYARRKHREPCRKIVSMLMSLRIDRVYERKLQWDGQLANPNSETALQLSYEVMKAMDSAMSMTPFSDEFMEAKVNKIYNGDEESPGVYANLTLMFDENAETLRPSLKADIQRHLLGVIHRRNNNIGNSALYVESPPGTVSNFKDLDECTSNELNDCHPEAVCTNIWGSFRCECQSGLRDPWADQLQRAGRECYACPDAYCNNRGTCTYDNAGAQVCTCVSSYYGAQCEIDGEVLGVAVGASVAAVIIIVLTLVCLVMWSRRWQREHKNAMGSPVFGYMTGQQVKTPVMGQPPYQVTLEDRMRWAQIADVMAQANHYGAEPVNSTRPSSALFGYPNLQTMSNMNTLANMSTLGKYFQSTVSMAGTLPMQSSTLPPVPLPRLGLSRPSGMRTLENSSSSEEEDRTDLLGRNFHVPRPKSRSNASVTSGIYYDVEYAPAGEIYNSSNTTTSTSIPGPQGIPMSTYMSNNRNSNSYYK